MKSQAKTAPATAAGPLPRDRTRRRRESRFMPMRDAQDVVTATPPATRATTPPALATGRAARAIRLRSPGCPDRRFYERLSVPAFARDESLQQHRHDERSDEAADPHRQAGDRVLSFVQAGGTGELIVAPALRS